jgi:cobalt/nickel transport system permease protein
LVCSSYSDWSSLLVAPWQAGKPDSMHSDAFDRYHHTESFLHRLDPRVKVLGTVGIILSVVLLPDGAWAAFGVTWAFILSLNLLSGLGPGYTLKRSFIALPFALVAVTAIFNVPGETLFQWHIGPWVLVGTIEGVIRFISIVVRSWLSVQVAILLVAVTRFPDLIHALEHLRIPVVLTTIVAFLYRYLFVLTDEVFRLLRARDARSASLPGTKKSGGTVFWRARIAGNMAGQLFLRSYERSDRIYNAMMSRGYTGYIRTLNPHIMKSMDWLAAAVALAALVIIQLVGRI